MPVVDVVSMCRAAGYCALRSLMAVARGSVQTKAESRREIGPSGLHVAPFQSVEHEEETVISPRLWASSVVGVAAHGV